MFWGQISHDFSISAQLRPLRHVSRFSRSRSERANIYIPAGKINPDTYREVSLANHHLDRDIGCCLEVMSQKKVIPIFKSPSILYHAVALSISNKRSLKEIPSALLRSTLHTRSELIHSYSPTTYGIPQRLIISPHRL